MPQYMLYYFLCFLWSFLETSSYSWLSALAAFVSQVCEVLGWGQNTWTHCQMSPWAPSPSALSSWLTNLEAFPLGSLIRKWNAITRQAASFVSLCIRGDLCYYPMYWFSGRFIHTVPDTQLFIPSPYGRVTPSLCASSPTKYRFGKRAKNFLTAPFEG